MADLTMGICGGKVVLEQVSLLGILSSPLGKISPLSYLRNCFHRFVNAYGRLTM